MENKNTIQERVEVLDSKRWFNDQPRDIWLSINDIPGAIFWSVWFYIDINKRVLLEDNSYLILPFQLKFEL